MINPISTILKDEKMAVTAGPAVSIFLPFEPIMTGKKALQIYLAAMSTKLEKALLENYSFEMVKLLMQKLNDQVGQLNFTTHRKSIAIYVSPVFEKIIYLNFHIEEKIKIEKSFRMRDLVSGKKQTEQYLLLHISNNQTAVYLHNEGCFKRIAAYRSAYPDGGLNDMKNASGYYLQSTDLALHRIFKAYPYPFFVTGNSKVLEAFKHQSRHQQRAAAFITANAQDYTPQELAGLMQAYPLNPHSLQQHFLMQQLQAASMKNKLVSGMTDVWQYASQQRGKLLLIDQQYLQIVEASGIDKMIDHAFTDTQPGSYIKDLLDDIIAKVLANGGEAAWIDNGLMKNHQPIALIYD